MQVDEKGKLRLYDLAKLRQHIAAEERLASYLVAAATAPMLLSLGAIDDLIAIERLPIKVALTTSFLIGFLAIVVSAQSVLLARTALSAISRADSDFFEDDDDSVIGAMAVYEGGTGLIAKSALAFLAMEYLSFLGLLVFVVWIAP